MTAMRPLPGARLASQGKLETLYMDWQAGQQRNGGNRNLLIALGWSRGLSLSSETTEARGLTRVDRLGGQVRVEIDGMDPAQGWDIWLVDNQEGPQRSSLPERATSCTSGAAQGREREGRAQRPLRPQPVTLAHESRARGEGAQVERL
jgi:hypothetical protein